MNLNLSADFGNLIDKTAHSRITIPLLRHTVQGLFCDIRLLSFGMTSAKELIVLESIDLVDFCAKENNDVLAYHFSILPFSLSSSGINFPLRNNM